MPCARRNTLAWLGVAGARKPTRIGWTELQDMQWKGFTNPRRKTDMRKQIVVAAVVGVFALGLAGSLAWAAGAVSANIPFSFIANDKEMPAGRYEIRIEGNDEGKLVVRSIDGGGQVFVMVIERLADTGAKEAKIVFDKMEDGKIYLSEIHRPGRDGFLVGIAKGRETHVTIIGKE
jgi:hypothetical protein